MSDSLSITLHERVFQCPNCKETINTSVEQCPFCSHVIDSGTAQDGADFMARVNQACSDSRTLKTLACFFPVLFALSFVMTSFKMLAVTSAFGVLGAAIRWRVKFGAIKVDDPDFNRAMRITMILLCVFGALGAIIAAINLRSLFVS